MQPEILPSPSRMAVEAAGLVPIYSTTAPTRTRCAMCGTPISQGEKCNDFVPSIAFNDSQYLTDQNSHYLCGYCVQISSKDFLQKRSRSVVAEGKFWKFASNNDRAYFLLNPPKPPFIMLGTDATQQHLIWRCPVSVSKDVFFVRYGHRLLRIRHAKLLQAVDASKRLSEKLTANQAANAGKGRPKVIRSPYVRIDRMMTDVTHGMLRNDTIALAQNNMESSRDVDLLSSLTPGETWALSAIIYATDTNTHPEPIV